MDRQADDAALEQNLSPDGWLIARSSHGQNSPKYSWRGCGKRKIYTASARNFPTKQYLWNRHLGDSYCRSTETQHSFNLFFCPKYWGNGLPPAAIRPYLRLLNAFPLAESHTSLFWTTPHIIRLWHTHHCLWDCKTQLLPTFMERSTNLKGLSTSAWMDIIRL